jgi:hypothetical protein
MSKLQWKRAGKSSGGNPKYEANNVEDGQGLRVIFYGEDPPTDIEIAAPKVAAASAKATSGDGAKAVLAYRKKLAKRLGLTLAQLDAAEAED